VQCKLFRKRIKRDKQNTLIVSMVENASQLLEFVPDINAMKSVSFAISGHPIITGIRIYKKSGRATIISRGDND
jgi:hypothetical protein